MPIRAIVLDIGGVLEHTPDLGTAARWEPEFGPGWVHRVGPVFRAGEVGIMKPDPAIYELCLDRLGMRADEAVFVDDVEDDCEAARALGMSAVRFQDTAQVIRDLDALLQKG